MRASLIGLASIATLLAACSHTPKTTADATPGTGATPTHSTAAQGSSQGVASSSVQPAQVAPNAATASTAAKRVLFDFDDYTVKPVYSDLLLQESKELGTNKAEHLTLQGNADERGSAEYNLALGQKRAEAVRKALSVLGVPENRMEAISFGKEKPLATCHDESCWSQNRRVDFAEATKK